MKSVGNECSGNIRVFFFLFVCVLFRFCVVIKKENYPDQQPAKMVTGSAKQIYRQPGHTIYLLPTLVLTNLLPCDLNYYVKGTSIKGNIKPGKEAVLHAADTTQNIELGKSETNLCQRFLKKTSRAVKLLK